LYRRREIAALIARIGARSRKRRGWLSHVRLVTISGERHQLRTRHRSDEAGRRDPGKPQPVRGLVPETAGGHSADPHAEDPPQAKISWFVMVVRLADDYTRNRPRPHSRTAQARDRLQQLLPGFTCSLSIARWLQGRGLPDLRGFGRPHDRVAVHGRLPSRRSTRPARRCGVCCEKPPRLIRARSASEGQVRASEPHQPEAACASLSSCKRGKMNGQLSVVSQSSCIL